MPASQTKEEVDPVNCPICGGKETAPILYGLPLFDEELKRKLRDHRIVLGGCLVSPFDPITASPAERISLIRRTKKTGNATKS